MTLHRMSPLYRKLAFLLVFAAPLPVFSSSPQTQWIGTWASSPIHPSHTLDPNHVRPATAPRPPRTDITIREVVRVSAGGETLRVRFSNLDGTSPLLIGAAQIAKTLHTSAIQAATARALTFHGAPSISIPAGALAFSDPVSFSLAPVSDLTVSFYVADASDFVTEHQLASASSYHAPGNVVANEDLDTPLIRTTWEYLNGIDVLTTAKAAAIVTLGDSITDGAYSTANANQRWPDELARRLQANPKYKRFSVLNEAISGNKLLVDGAGPNSLARFDRDILSQSGVKYLIILEGINDIGHIHTDPTDTTTAADLIRAFDQMIVRAHTHGIVVIGATLTPFHGAHYSSEKTEAIRTTINQWIRTSGEFDAVIDFDAAVRDPSHPDTFLPALDHGDHLHPNDAGYRAMGDYIDLKLFSLKPHTP